MSAEQWWWLSFADPKAPKGSQLLGAAIVPGSNEIEAVRRAHAEGINPGGEVALMRMPRPPRPEYALQLFNAERARAVAEVSADELMAPS